MDPALIPFVVTLHDASTWFLVGLIWVIQAVHYPLFAKVGVDSFVPYQLSHVRRITPVVLPPMLIELVTAVLLAFQPEPGLTAVRWTGLALVGSIWLSTFLVQVPLHARLERGFDETAHRRLVGSNVWRTAAWTFRGLLVCFTWTF